MKLTDIQPKTTLQKLNKISESRFGFKIDYNQITYPRAVKMRNKIMETVNKIRHSSAIHTAERDPKYLEMLIVFEGLSRWIDAHNEQSRNLMEGELGQAEVILAAKDMVDTTQDMIEKVGKMQNEQLPALIDSIRDQIGAAQADTFKNTVGQTLAALSQQLSQAREQLDNGARGLTGEGASMNIGAEAGVGDMDGMDSGIPAMGEPDMEAPPDEFGATDAAAGGPEAIGRERR
jgi:hypothetical protein